MIINKTPFVKSVTILAKSVKIIHLVLNATQISLENSTSQPSYALVWRATLKMNL
jgi:hypothetical protein